MNQAEKTDDQLWNEALEEAGVTEEDIKDESISNNKDNTSDTDAKEVTVQNPSTDENGAHANDDTVAPKEKEDKVVVSEEEELENDPFVQQFLAGKSKKEWVEILKKNNTHISQLSNEQYKLKKELEEYKVSKNSGVEQNKDDLIEQLNTKYDPEQIKDITNIINHIETKRERADRERLEVQQKQIEMQNENFWEVYKFANAEMAQQIEPALFEALRKDASKGSETLKKANWVKDFILSFKPVAKPIPGSAQDDGLIRRKQQASVSGSSSSAVAPHPLKGKPQPKDPDQYVEWVFVNQGIRI